MTNSANSALLPFGPCSVMTCVTLDEHSDAFGAVVAGGMDATGHEAICSQTREILAGKAFPPGEQAQTVTPLVIVVDEEHAAHAETFLASQASFVGTTVIHLGRDEDFPGVVQRLRSLKSIHKLVLMGHTDSESFSMGAFDLAVDSLVAWAFELSDLGAMVKDEIAFTSVPGSPSSIGSDMSASLESFLGCDVVIETLQNEMVDTEFESYSVRDQPAVDVSWCPTGRDLHALAQHKQFLDEQSSKCPPRQPITSQRRRKLEALARATASNTVEAANATSFTHGQAVEASANANQCDRDETKPHESRLILPGQDVRSIVSRTDNSFADWIACSDETLDRFRPSSSIAKLSRDLFRANGDKSLRFRGRLPTSGGLILPEDLSWATKACG